MSIAVKSEGNIELGSVSSESRMSGESQVSVIHMMSGE